RIVGSNASFPVKRSSNASSREARAAKFLWGALLLSSSNSNDRLSILLSSLPSCNTSTKSTPVNQPAIGRLREQ
uniref:Uncharacterized protein n=1 Tax=Aegilops tauschii subsp. strangulata TaxID=200361 RepID=A0A453KSE5_AEGTS